MFPSRNYKKYKLDIPVASDREEVRCLCPECEETRTNKGDKSCCVNQKTGLWFCQHCGAKGYVPTFEEEKEKEEKKSSSRHKKTLSLRPGSPPSKGGRGGLKNYRRPAWEEPQNGYELESSVARYVLSRGLDLAVGRQLRVTSSLMGFNREVEVVTTDGKREKRTVIDKKQCILFNYFEQGMLINQKSRALDKSFYFVKDAELIPYNIDAILGQKTCCITEGEFDCWAMVQCGYAATISVPNGGASRADWLDRFVESHFDDKEMIILALDTDEVGRKMRDELVRRLGFNRCYVVEWDDGCKDANEELQKYGAEGVVHCVAAAQLLPLTHTYTAADVRDEVMDLFHNGSRPGLACHVSEGFDRLMTFEPGRYMLVTGRPGDGKSEFVDELVLRMSLLYDWRACYFSPENVPVTYHIRKLSERLTGQKFEPSPHMTEQMALASIQWQSDNICYIVPEEENLRLSSTDVDISQIDREAAAGEGDDWDVHFQLRDILQCVHRAVVRLGIRVAVLDPLNRIDYSDLPGDSEFERLNRLNSLLSQFAVHHGILLILVAHPRKVNRAEFTGQRRHVEMNDISGTADFGSKCDYCLVVDRDDERGVVTVYVEKCKFKHLGTRGYATFHYVKENGRYLNCKVTRIPPDPMDPDSKATYSKEVDWTNADKPWIDGEGRYTGLLMQYDADVSLDDLSEGSVNGSQGELFDASAFEPEDFVQEEEDSDEDEEAHKAPF